MTKTLALSLTATASLLATLPAQETVITGAASKAKDKPRILDPLVSSDSIWDMHRADFEKTFKPVGFQWNSNKKQTARFAGHNLTLWDQKVGETLVEFKDDTVHRVGVSIYNRGDNKVIRNRDTFEKLVANWKTQMAEKSGTEAVDRGRDSKSAAKAYGYLFKDKKTTRLLEFSFQREHKSRRLPFTAEFLKLKFARTPKDDFFRSHQGVAGQRKSLSDLKRLVVKKPNGDVLVPDIPMVDQGQKGYCVVASCERVMRYYGLNVDQHEMAQVAAADAGRGTSTDAMVNSLKRLSGRLKLRTRTHQDVSMEDIQKSWAPAYNRAVKKWGDEFPKAKQLDTSRFIFYPNAFEGELLKRARLTRTNEYLRFKKRIREHIDEGIPMLWALWLGYFKEGKLPQMGGGHMRLIIGYNDKTEEILYSDSWGAGFELRRMPTANAFTATTGLFTVEPSR